MDYLLLVSITLLIQSIIFYYKISEMQPKIKTKILREIKMHHLNMIYGKKAEFDKKYLPIIVGIIFFIYYLLYLVGIYIFGFEIKISDFISFFLIGLSMIIIWKAFNKEIIVYLCEDGIYYINRFISWEKFEEYKKDNDFIELLGKKIKILGKKVCSIKRIYLPYDKEVENIIKNHIK
ncbi:DUF986 domain-containing protein [Methanocaldococcus sp. 10A]